MPNILIEELNSALDQLKADYIVERTNKIKTDSSFATLTEELRNDLGVSTDIMIEWAALSYIAGLTSALAYAFTTIDSNVAEAMEGIVARNKNTIASGVVQRLKAGILNTDNLLMLSKFCTESEKNGVQDIKKFAKEQIEERLAKN